MAKETINPLLTAKWGQRKPFNYKMIHNGNVWSTGCNTTAIAQILYYWNKKGYYFGCKKIEPYEKIVSFPFTNVSGKSASFTYKVDVSLPAIDRFDFRGIIDNYETSEKNYLNSYISNIDTNNLALLCLYIQMAIKSTPTGTATSTSKGWANINYDYTSISAYPNDIKNGLTDYFNFEGIQVIGVSDTNPNNQESSEIVDIYKSLEDVSEIIYSELSQGAPVIISGKNSNGAGHAFVCDGYNATNNKYHINWGGRGSGDCWCDINNLQIGSGTAYNARKSVVIGIRPRLYGFENIDKDTLKQIYKDIEINNTYLDDINFDESITKQDTETLCELILENEIDYKNKQDYDQIIKFSSLIKIRKYCEKLLGNFGIFSKTSPTITYDQFVWIGTSDPTLSSIESLTPKYSQLDELNNTTITVNPGEKIYLVCPIGALTEESRLNGNIIENNFFIYKFQNNPDITSIPGHAIYQSKTFEDNCIFNLEF